MKCTLLCTYNQIRMRYYNYKHGKDIYPTTGYRQFYHKGKVWYKGYQKNNIVIGYNEVTNKSWINTGIKYII